MKVDRLLEESAFELASLLKSRDLKMVFAESCTGGMVSAALTGIPGISSNLCGSFVTYRNDSKSRWLGISSTSLLRPGPVSEQVARNMAAQALKRTPEADLAASITGYLGPVEDGRLFVGVALRGVMPIFVTEFHFLSAKKTLKKKTRKSPILLRKERVENQKYASHAVLFMVRSLLKFADPAA